MKLGRTRLVLIGLIGLIGLTCVLVGCQLPQEANSTEIVVGGLFSKTGAAGGYGVDSDNGAQMAVDEINLSDSQVKIDYMSMDDKTDKTEAIKAARSLIDVFKVDAIVGPTISPSALVVGKIAEDRQIPMITTSATQDEVTVSNSYDRQYVSRVCFADSFQGTILANFARNSLQAKSALIAYDKSLSYSVGLANRFEEEFSNLGGSVVHRESFSSADTDFSPLIDKIALYEADVLFIPAWDEQVGPMLKQSGDKWSKFTLLGGDGWISEKLLELSGGNVGRAFAVSHFSPDDPSERTIEFRNRFKEKYGEEPSPLAALGYDSIYLVHDAAIRSTASSDLSLKDAINSTEGLKLITGTLTLDENRNPEKDAFIMKVQSDGFQFYERVRPFRDRPEDR